MKKLVSFVIGIAVILSASSVTFAENAGTTTNQQSEVSDPNPISVSRNINLEDALNNIDQVNPDLQLLDKKIEVLNKQYENDKSKSIAPDDSMDDVDYHLQKDYNYKESLSNLNNTKMDRDEKLKSIKNDLKKQYLNALCDQEDIENTKKLIENLDDKIKNQNLKIQLGQATDSSLETLKTQKSSLQTSLNNLQVQLQSELLNIKQYLNLDMSQEIILTPIEEKYVKFDDTGIDTRIENAIDKNPDVIKQQSSLDLLKSKTGTYMSYGGKYANQIRGFQINIEEQSSALDQLKLATQIKLVQAYYDLKNANDLVSQEQVNLQNAEDDFKAAQAKYSVGVIDKPTEVDSSIALNQEKTKLKRAIDNCTVSSENLKNLLEE
ncbi:TolC family protein [Clostridium ljungdahlii]|uniref:Outer membrane efflux protein n=1 Tax=Clostridium ljungdahlii TaxID=1538 RepID=A0A168NU10_9CLOT|nr:TolC family protein [Clostridium ljungdahlii]OAA86901.1 Outer membrane efflux protein [Clostridium ljungdahlii]